MIPDQMKALRAHVTKSEPAEAIDALRVETIAVPKPGPGQVLVRMKAAPFNPADLLYITGKYGIDRPLPATLGFEGAGEVVANGGGMIARFMMGKTVAAGGHAGTGTFAEYLVTDATQCVPLRKGLTVEQGATAMANPLTALSLVGIAKKGGHRAIVQTGAAGQLGRMLAGIAKNAGIPVINIVRREAQAAACIGETLVSESPGFAERLRERAAALSATIAFDAVAGPMTGTLVNALPKNSEIVIYGALSGEPSGAIDPMQVAFGYKKIRGFEIAGHLKDGGLVAAMRLASAAQKMVLSGTVASDVRVRVGLDGAKAELLTYARAMSTGKVLLTP